MFTGVATIDGPPASGKSTIASMLAKSLNLTHLDSGAVFRSITLFCINKGVDLTNKQTVFNQLRYIQLELIREQVLLNGYDVAKDIRSAEVSKQVCLISHIPDVRKYVVNFQRSYAKTGKIVCDGRKAGTEIFPYADVKFYLTADLTARARRRFNQFVENQPATYNPKLRFSDVYKDIKEREKYEMKNGLLTIPDNAIIIDNTFLSLEETLRQMALCLV